MAGTGGRYRVLADRYELHHRLGRGGAGTVWRGHDRALDRPVAVKLLHGDLADDRHAGVRFRTEATAAAKLTHPNAVLVYDLGTVEDDTFLVMELVEGVNLGDLLEEGPLPAGVAAHVAAQVASALGTAHTAGIVHRDVKPANVLVTTDGVAKLADFGIARALGAVTSRLTRTGTVLGTARYLAPEQLRDDPLDARADVYALGLVLHEMLTGDAPFGEGSAVEVAARRLTTTLPRVSDLVPGVPPDLVEIIDWATRIDPRERPDDGAAFASALRTLAADDAATVVAARVARVPQRNTTPVASDRIRPIDPSLPPPTAPPPPAGASPRGAGDRDDGVVDDGTGAHSATRALPITPAWPTPAGGGPATGATGRPSAVAAGAAPRRATAAYGPSAGGAGGAVSDADGEPGGDGASGPAVDGDPGPSKGRRWVLGAVAAVAVLLVAIGLSGDDGGGEPSGGGATSPTEDADGAGEALPIAAAGDLDPEGDLRERPDDVENAIDGDGDTFWPTETYRSADFSGLPKSGVGIWLELEEPRALDRVEVELSVEGGSLELWASADGPPSDDQLPDEWGTRLGGGTVPAARMQFPELPDSEVRTVLLWFTELPEGGNGWRGEIREVRLIGR